MRLADSLVADDLAAEQPAGAALGDELDADGLRARVVAGPGRRIDDDADDSEAGLRGLAGRQAGAGDLGAADLGRGGAEDAGEGGVAAADVVARDAALLVGVGSERDVTPAGRDRT